MEGGLRSVMTLLVGSCFAKKEETFTGQIRKPINVLSEIVGSALEFYMYSIRFTAQNRVVLDTQPTPPLQYTARW